MWKWRGGRIVVVAVVVLVLTNTLLSFYTSQFQSKSLATGPLLLSLSQGEFRRSPPNPPSAPLVNPPAPRVTCLVVTSPQHHQDRARHVEVTWGHDGACTDLIYLTSAPHPDLTSVHLSSYANYEELWGKVVEGFLSLNSTSAEWYLKADDDTFLVSHNLLDLLSVYDPGTPLYLGLPLVYLLQEGDRVEYNSGGAGYVLSRAALTLLQEAHHPHCHPPGHTLYEDVNMGLCMRELGVGVSDTRDALGRPRFLPIPPWDLLQPDLITAPRYTWLQKLSKYPFLFGPEHLSDRAISFHNIRNPRDFYLLHYLTHDLAPLPPTASRPFKRMPS